MFRRCRNPAAILAFVLIASLLPRAWGAESKPLRRVLILNEAGATYPLIKLVDDGIQAGFRDSPFVIQFYREYMETILFPDPADQQLYRDFVIRKYRDRQPDVIITVGSSPAKFLLESHRRAFPGVPVVFCYPNALSGSLLTLDSDTTAVGGDLSPARTIDAALRLLPNTTHLAVVTGVTPFDRHYQAMIKEELRGYERRLEISYVTDMPLASVLERLRHLPYHSIVLIGPYGRDPSGAIYTTRELGPLLVGASNAPVFSLSDTFMNHGEVGGDVTSAMEQGKLGAGLAIRFLKGERNVPPVKESTAYTFDWIALKRWHLKESRLPPGSIILNREPGFWEQYKQYVLFGALVLLIQMIVIMRLLWERRRRRTIEAELRKSEDKFSKSFRHSPLAIVMVRMNGGRIIEVNDAFEQLTGWNRNEVIGRSLQDVQLGLDANRNSQIISQFRTSGDVRDAEIPFRQRDGQLRIALASAELIEVNGDPCALCVAADITDRKRAEDALSNVSRKLVEAQEAERTRIARELHDDISQRMAMLALRLKKVKKDLPVSELKAIRAVDEACTGVSGLATDIQTLSHRLHSSKLEYLGLAGASAAFCRELSEQENVTIDFHADEVPEHLSTEVSLCVFRVLQEALHNALKHSGVRHFAVSLKSTSDELQLVVRDSGVGFDTANSALGNGLGLTSMKERLRLIDGQLLIESRPQEGTKIVALVPLAASVSAL